MMTENQKRYMYKILDKSTVFVDIKKSKIDSNKIMIDTYYHFGNYKVSHLTTFPAEDMGLFIIYKKGEQLDAWDETSNPEQKYVYYAYIAAKNKNQGKQYINPYKIKKSKMFSNIIHENQCLVFPDAMPSDKRIAAIKELKQILQKHIAPYRTK